MPAVRLLKDILHTTLRQKQISAFESLQYTPPSKGHGTNFMLETLWLFILLITLVKTVLVVRNRKQLKGRAAAEKEQPLRSLSRLHLSAGFLPLEAVIFTLPFLEQLSEEGAFPACAVALLIGSDCS